MTNCRPSLDSIYLPEDVIHVKEDVSGLAPNAEAGAVAMICIHPVSIVCSMWARPGQGKF